MERFGGVGMLLGADSITRIVQDLKLPRKHTSGLPDPNWLRRYRHLARSGL